MTREEKHRAKMRLRRDARSQRVGTPPAPQPGSYEAIVAMNERIETMVRKTKQRSPWAMRKKPTTIRDQLARGLERLGYVPDTLTRSTRYTVYRDGNETPTAGRYFKIWLGKAGAVRGGSVVAYSIPLDSLKLKALAEGGRP